MQKQLVLVVDSDYGPSGFSSELLFTEETKLDRLIFEMDQRRVAGQGSLSDNDREPWSIEEIHERMAEGEVMEDDFWFLDRHNIDVTFTIRLARGERKWYAIGLGYRKIYLPEYIVISPNPSDPGSDEWFDFVSFESKYQKGVPTYETALRSHLAKVAKISHQWPAIEGAPRDCATAIPITVQFESGGESRLDPKSLNDLFSIK